MSRVVCAGCGLEGEADEVPEGATWALCPDCDPIGTFGDVPMTFVGHGDVDDGKGESS